MKEQIDQYVEIKRTREDRDRTGSHHRAALRRLLTEQQFRSLKPENGTLPPVARVVSLFNLSGKEIRRRQKGCADHETL